MIPEGRKRALQVTSQARVKTSDEVHADLEWQKVLEEKKQEDHAKKRQRTQQQRQKNKVPASKKVFTDKKLTQLHKNVPQDASSEELEDEDNQCFQCDRLWSNESKLLQPKWVGCDKSNCKHWDFAHDVFQLALTIIQNTIV